MNADSLRQKLKCPRRILAVDPGLSGAVALVGAGEIQVWRDFKTGRDIAKAVREALPLATDVLVEFVAARPGQGVCSMFSFGKAAGTAFGALYALSELSVTEITPQVWQRHYRQVLEIPREVSFDARAVATSLFPDHAHLFFRKKDHNTADAVLIGLYGL